MPCANNTESFLIHLTILQDLYNIISLFRIISGFRLTQNNFRPIFPFLLCMFYRKHFPSPRYVVAVPTTRSEEHTSELQSRGQLVCRLLLETKKRSVRPTDRHLRAGPEPAHGHQQGTQTDPLSLHDALPI